MSDYSGGDAERDAFLAALSSVFAEHRTISERYGICNLTRLADMIGGGFDEPVGVRRDESGKIVTSLSEEFPNPIAEKLGDECVALIPNFGADPPWDCIMYLTS